MLVHDPLDEGLMRLGLVDVVDAETGRWKVVDGRALKGRATVEERLRRLRRTGAGAVAIGTEDDPFNVLHGYFGRAQRRGR